MIRLVLHRRENEKQKIKSCASISRTLLQDRQKTCRYYKYNRAISINIVCVWLNINAIVEHIHSHRFEQWCKLVCVFNFLDRLKPRPNQVISCLPSPQLQSLILVVLCLGKMCSSPAFLAKKSPLTSFTIWAFPRNTGRETHAHMPMLSLDTAWLQRRCYGSGKSLKKCLGNGTRREERRDG